LGESERAELRAAAAADRASDVLAFIHAVREVCE
jgi:hypothetical protein